MSYEYILSVESTGECTIQRDNTLNEREVIESDLGAVVVESVDAHPGDGAPGRARCRRFAPVHQAE